MTPMNVPRSPHTPWWRRIVYNGWRAIGVFERESIFARNGEDRWTTPRRYDEQDFQLVSWPPTRTGR
jgi:hypothetical protein